MSAKDDLIVAEAVEEHRRDVSKAMGWFLLYGEQRAREMCVEEFGFDPGPTAPEPEPRAIWVYGE